MQEITLRASLECLSDMVEFIGGAALKAGIGENIQNNIMIAAEEIFVNIANYAYPAGGGYVTVRVYAEQGKFAMQFADRGIQYNPLAKTDPDISLSADDREIGGLGIFMVKQMMDGLRYEYMDGQNILTIEKSY